MKKYIDKENFIFEYITENFDDIFFDLFKLNLVRISMFEIQIFSNELDINL